MVDSTDMDDDELDEDYEDEELQSLNYDSPIEQIEEVKLCKDLLTHLA